MDKKLNEVTKVTDMAYMPVILADGSIGQIAKADLASVVADKIGNVIYNATPTTGENYICDCSLCSFVILFLYPTGRYGLYFVSAGDSDGTVTPICKPFGVENFFDGFTVRDSKLYLNCKVGRPVSIWRLTKLI